MSLALIKVAWDHAPTPVGYKRLTIRRLKWVLSLGGPPLIALVCIGRVPYAGTAFAMIIVLVAPYLPWVIIAFIRRHRVRAVLRAYPWCEWPCQYPRRPPGSPATIAIPFREDFTATLRILPFPIALAQLENDHPDRIWFAGDPRFGGVVSPVGGHYPVRVVPHTPRREECGGEGFDLARRVGLVRASGKATRT
ncbi:MULTISPECIES: hypothetical protein [Streptomyces]|uniref:Uncharacterized protein n=1 Tax=Streptomyces virginiae TaxID=1961 RepID=A0ABQ3NHU4_STRVG|nr:MULTISPECIES: hypothetical protein [Streptomyces]KOU87874.1 hypothetical protein ADK94_11980 [Streptomyces sp. XY593]MBP2347565.1 hypothetical protein [Streptomyces virginiae]GGQ04678.1 hypothetical protein GCM10010215_32670 [Streptomyces virginiae]GHI12341.1 hypothetical protein Scinn_18040 [Streptomyces virginiae]